MANIGEFSVQLVALVRSMPDEALLDLVKYRLDASGGTPGAARRGPRARARTVAAPAPRAKRAAKRGAPRGRRVGAPSADRQAALNAVERIVKSGSGVSASDVARSASIPQTRAAAALKQLKLDKRIFQGGDRRFARYAADSKTAEQASLHARTTASGPAVKRKAKRGRKKK
jgi:hypothetical protein